MLHCSYLFLTQVLSARTENIAVSTIIDNYRSGLWSIPEPLAAYEWDRQKQRAAMFIASLHIGWPVWAITLWESQVVHHSPKQLDCTEAEHIAWMLDGHQQILALCKAMDKESNLRIVFNPRVTDMQKGTDGQFRVQSAMTRKSPGWIDVSRILGSREDFYAVLSDEKTEEYAVRLIQLREIFNRKMAVLRFSGADYDTVLKAYMEVKALKKALRKRGSVFSDE